MGALSFDILMLYCDVLDFPSSVAYNSNGMQLAENPALVRTVICGIGSFSGCLFPPVLFRLEIVHV